MRILLVNPYSSYKASGMRFQLPNPALASLTAVLKEAGFLLDLCDFNIFENPMIGHIENYLEDNNYCAVGISVSIDTLEFTSGIIRKIKKINPDLPVVIGGVPLKYQPELWMNETGADIGVIGEGEQTAPELFTALHNKVNISNINGIIYKEDNQLLVTPQRLILTSLNCLPISDYSLFDLKSYFSSQFSRWLFNNLKGFYVMTSRGCVYNCHFCSSIGGIRALTSERVAQEVSMIVEKYKLESVFLRDDIFTYDQKRVYEISEKLGEMNIQWLCMSRPNLLCRAGDKDLIMYMAKNDCRTIMMGIESYNQDILDRNMKKINVDDIDRAIDNCQSAGIRVIGFILFGLPGETEETIRNTLEFIKKTNIDVSANILQPLPGSKIYEDAIISGKIKNEVQYLKDFHLFWDREGEYLPVNMTFLPDNVILNAANEAQCFKNK